MSCDTAGNEPSRTSRKANKQICLAATMTGGKNRLVEVAMLFRPHLTRLCGRGGRLAGGDRPDIPDDAQNEETSNYDGDHFRARCGLTCFLPGTALFEFLSAATWAGIVTTWRSRFHSRILYPTFGETRTSYLSSFNQAWSNLSGGSDSCRSTVRVVASEARKALTTACRSRRADPVRNRRQFRSGRIQGRRVGHPVRGPSSPSAR